MLRIRLRWSWPNVEPPAVALALAIAVAFVIQARAWVFLCDDAFISFRYAEHLVRHGALEFNLGERVEGYTDFLWVVVLALGAWLGVDPPAAAPVLSVAAAVVVLVAVTDLTRRLRGADERVRSIDLLPAAWLVVVPEFAVWLHGGLETSAEAAALVLSLHALVRARLAVAGGWAAVAVLLRPDAVVVLGLAALGRLLGGPGSRPSWAEVRRAALVGLVPVLAHLAFRRLYYDAWMPNTWAIKAHGTLLREAWGGAYLMQWLHGTGLAWTAPLLLALRRRHAIVALPLSGAVAYPYWIGGDFMAYGRLLVPATVLAAVLVGWVAAELEPIVARRFAARPVRAAVLAIGLGAAAIQSVRAIDRHRIDRDSPVRWLDGRFEGVHLMDRFARVRLAAGAWMRDNLPPDTWITVGAAGALPYASDLPAIDVYGLVDPELGRLGDLVPLSGEGARPGHQLVAPDAYLRARDPDLVCHAGHAGPQRPTEAQAPRAWRRGFAWACIDLPEIEDRAEPQGSLDPGWYCCRRPSDRAVGPFVEGGP